MKKKILLTGLLAMVLIMALMSAAFALESLAISYRYPVKFVCGQLMSSATGSKTPLADGNYLTAINVHNPSLTASVKFGKKVAATSYWAVGWINEPFISEEQGPVTDWFKASLAPNHAFEINCSEILDKVCDAAGPYCPENALHFAKGFVVIMSPLELDVTAVYTLEGSFSGSNGASPVIQGTGSFSIAVETIQGKAQKATIAFPAP
jgi:hypothetical protein